MSYRSVFKAGLFDQQVVIVTGGGSGIGRCTAHELASLGAKVALVGRKREKLDAVVAEIAQQGGVASAHVCDIREEEVVRQTVSDVLAVHGRIDGLVNNAGGQFQAPLDRISAKGWDGHARHGALRRSSCGHAQFHRNSGFGMGAGSSQRGGPRLDCLKRHGPIPT